MYFAFLGIFGDLDDLFDEIALAKGRHEVNSAWMAFCDHF